MLSNARPHSAWLNARWLPPQKSAPHASDGEGEREDEGRRETGVYLIKERGRGAEDDPICDYID